MNSLSQNRMNTQSGETYKIWLPTLHFLQQMGQSLLFFILNLCRLETQRLKQRSRKYPDRFKIVKANERKISVNIKATRWKYIKLPPPSNPSAEPTNQIPQVDGNYTLDQDPSTSPYEIAETEFSHKNPIDPLRTFQLSQ